MKKFTALALLMCPQFAMAHPGHAETGVISGFFHPLTGFDHLAAMFGLGLVCSLHFIKDGAFKWLMLALLVTSLGVGALGAIAGFKVPLFEMMILLSVALVGALVFSFGLGQSVKKWVLCGLALLSAFHGYVHIVEGAAVTISDLSYYTLGFTLSSVGLYGLGLILGSKIAAISLKSGVFMFSGGFYIALALVLGL